MSESDQSEPTVECALCGRNGNPPEECEKCHGKAAIQPRGYTLSEERSGRAPDSGRYGDNGQIGPKIVTLPGSAGQG